MTGERGLIEGFISPSSPLHLLYKMAMEKEDGRGEQGMFSLYLGLKDQVSIFCLFVCFLHPS